MEFLEKIVLFLIIGLLQLTIGYITFRLISKEIVYRRKSSESLNTEEKKNFLKERNKKILRMYLPIFTVVAVIIIFVIAFFKFGF